MTFVRTNKRGARKRYERGQEFWITGSNMRPECGLLINPQQPRFDDETFDKIVNAFMFYNCNYYAGYSPAYYVMMDENGD